MKKRKNSACPPGATPPQNIVDRSKKIGERRSDWQKRSRHWQKVEKGTNPQEPQNRHLLGGYGKGTEGGYSDRFKCKKK